MRRRPLLWLAAAFSVGVGFACLCRPPNGLLLGVAGLSLVLTAVLVWRDRWPVLQSLGLAVLVVVLGGLRWSGKNRTGADHVVHQVPEGERFLVRLEGRIRDRPEILPPPARSVLASPREDSAGRTRFLVGGLTFLSDAGQSRACSGLVQVTADGIRTDLRYGDEVRCLGWISRPRVPSNPGEFNYRRFLQRQGIHVVLYMKHPDNATVLSRGHGVRPLGWLFRLNDACRSFLYAHLRPREAALLDGLMLGNQRNIEPGINDDFTATGTRHVLSISGLHVGLVSAAVYMGLTLARLPIHYANPLAVLLTLFYSIFSGAQSPSLRAATMVGVFLLAPILKRPSDSLNLLGLSALIILGYDPDQLFRTGFQLSFAAVLGILLFTQDLMGLFRRSSLAEQLLTPAQRFGFWRVLRHQVLLSLCVTLAAWVATIGLVAASFNLVTPLAILANLIVCPLTFVILVLGILALVLSPLLAWPAILLLKVNGGFLWLLIESVHLIARFPLANLYVPTPSLFALVVFHLFLLLVAMRGVLRLNWRRLMLIAGLLVIGVAAAGRWRRAEGQGRMEVTVLDVGHGCAALVETPDGRRLLYDIGSHGSFDVTRRVVAPFLWQRGVWGLDQVILTHPDFDHYSGLLSLFQRFVVREVLVPPSFREKGAGRFLLGQAGDAGIAVREIADGDVVLTGDRWSIRVLNPPRDSAETPALSDNDASVVLQVTFGRTAVLLCGDIQSRAITYLLERHREDLKADVLLVPHHGGLVPMSGALADAVRPKIALINGWTDDAHLDTLREYRDRGAEIRLSETDGAIRVVMDEESVAVRSFLRAPDAGDFMEQAPDEIPGDGL